MSLRDIADCMKGGISDSSSPEDIQKFMDACGYCASDLSVEFWIDSGVTTAQAANIIRSAVIDRIAEIDSVLTLASTRGFILPSSPFPKITVMNRQRQIFGNLPWSDDTKDQFYRAATELGKIAKAHAAGEVTFDRSPGAQITSYESSVDGISAQSGDPLADILGYQPDGDFVKRKRALDSLARLDFSKRKPYLLFTAFAADGSIVVCWSKMHDAAGYVLSRRDVFANSDLPDITVTNESLEESTGDLLADERIAQLVTFYDWTTPQEVWLLSDPSVSSDRLYSYRVSGMQRKAPASPFIFDVPMTSLLFSPSVAAAAEAELIAEAELFGRDRNSMSPYPAISKALYGDAGFGWILAGCNSLAAVRRGDDADSVRSLAYIGSSADHLFSEGRAGRLFVPSDLGAVQASVENAISGYGVSQSILSILDGTGMTHFISGKDDPNGIQPTQASVDGSTSGLARILSAVDPETATLDPRLIVVSAQPTGSGRLAVIQVARKGPSFSELVGDEQIDLTTYSGVGRLMQILRSIYDFFPGAFS